MKGTQFTRRELFKRATVFGGGAGRSLEDVVAAKPTADLDVTWGKGFMQPDDFVAIVYNTL